MNTHCLHDHWYLRATGFSQQYPQMSRIATPVACLVHEPSDQLKAFGASVVVPQVRVLDVLVDGFEVFEGVDDARIEITVAHAISSKVLVSI